jgi:2',3'-cyclic-nucleotide 2'-phosphodiesterase (5'-nucleotidase family)
LDAGNSLTGDTPPATSSEGRTSIEVMNMMGYDAMALALGDLALGADALQQRAAEATFPLLSANATMRAGNQAIGKRYVIRQVGVHRVALIGLTEAGEAPGFAIADPMATARKVVPEVARQADIVIVLTHGPVSFGRRMAAAVPGIDLIITGGDEVIPNGETVGSALIVHADVAMPGHAGRNLGIINADFDAAGDLVKQTNTVMPLSENLPEDADVAAWVLAASQ